MQWRTRTVATLGPATDSPGILERLLDAGLDVARINFSHGAAHDHQARIARIRRLARERGRPTTILADLPGPKLRAILQAPLTFQLNQSITLAAHPGASADIQLTEPEAVARMQAGQRVMLDDGRLQARATAITRETITLTVEADGTLLPNKGVNFPDTELHIPALTQRDRDAIAGAACSRC